MDEFNGKAWYNPVDRKYYAGQSPNKYSGELYWNFTTIEAKVVLEQVMCLARPKYKLDQCCTIVNFPETVGYIDTATTLSASTKVRPLEEAEINTLGWDRTTFNLWKNVAHIVVEDEGQKASSHDVINLNIQDCAGAIAAARNTQIDTELQTATAAAANGYWDAMSTSPNNDYDPMDDICGVLKTIIGNGYDQDLFLGCDPTVWCNFITNTFIRDLVGNSIAQIQGSGTYTLPGFPNVKAIVDPSFLDTSAFLGSKRATILAEGPTEAARYRHEPKGYTGYIIRQWLQPEIVCTGGIREITGVDA